jgi:hypothetical protein
MHVGDADEMMLIKVGMLTTKSSSGKMLIGDNRSYPVDPGGSECVYTSPWVALEKVGALEGEVWG